MSREKSYSEIGARLRSVRERFGLKQKDFAADLGIKQSWLSELETGLKQPSGSMLKTIEYRYKIHHHLIMFGTDVKHYPGKTFDQILDIIVSGTTTPTEIAKERPVYYLDSVEKKIIKLLEGMSDEEKWAVLKYVQTQKHLVNELKKKEG